MKNKKKFFNNLSLILVFALTLCMLPGPSHIAKADELGNKLSISIVPSLEYVSIIPNNPDLTRNIYYAEVTENTKKVNSSKLIESYREGNEFLLSYSFLNTSKVTYLGYVQNFDPDTTGSVVLDGKIELNPGKGIKYNIDFSGMPNYSSNNIKDCSITAFIRSISMTDAAGKKHEYVPLVGNTYFCYELNDNLEVECSLSSKNANVLLNNSMTYYYFTKCGGSIYLKSTVEGDITSNITKYTIKEPTKAPSVKVDYSKGTVSLKNGMEISLDKNSWVYISPYQAKSTAVTIFSTGAGISTRKKINAVTADDIGRELGLGFTGEPQTIYYRTSGLARVLPSKIGKFTIGTRSAISVLTPGSVTVNGATGTTTIVVPHMTCPTKELEYMVVAAEHEDKVDLATSKWKNVAADTIALKNASKMSYTLLDGQKINLNIGSNIAVLVRQRGDKDTKRLPSNIIILRDK